MENAIEDIYHNSSPPKGFVTIAASLSKEENENFREGYINREFCLVVAVDLEEFRKNAL